MSLTDAMAKKKNRTSAQKTAAIQEVTKEPIKRLNVNIAESKLKRFKGKAATEGLEMTTLINQWVDEYLDK